MTTFERWYGDADANGHQLIRQRFQTVDVLPDEGLEGQPVLLTENNRVYLWSNAGWRRVLVATELPGVLLLQIEDGRTFQTDVGQQIGTVIRQLSTVHVGLGIGRSPEVTLDAYGLDRRMASVPQAGVTSRIHRWTMDGGKAVSAGSPFLMVQGPSISGMAMIAVQVIEQDGTTPRHTQALFSATKNGLIFLQHQGQPFYPAMPAPPPTYPYPEPPMPYPPPTQLYDRSISAVGNLLYWMNTGVIPRQYASLSDQSLIIVDIYALGEDVTVLFV